MVTTDVIDLTNEDQDTPSGGGDFVMGTMDNEGLTIYLYAGCNTTCHGALWMKKFIEKTGYDRCGLQQATNPRQGLVEPQSLYREPQDVHRAGD